MSPSAPIILTTKQMYHDPPITNFHGWKISHDEWICPTAPPSLSLFLFSRETASRINPRSSGKYFQYPLFQRNQEKCRSQKSREKKRERERACEHVFRKKISSIYRLLRTSSPPPPNNACNADYTRRYFEISARTDELSRRRDVVIRVRRLFVVGDEISR